MELKKLKNFEHESCTSKQNLIREISESGKHDIESDSLRTEAFIELIKRIGIIDKSLEMI